MSNELLRRAFGVDYSTIEQACFMFSSWHVETVYRFPWQFQPWKTEQGVRGYSFRMDLDYPDHSLGPNSVRHEIYVVLGDFSPNIPLVVHADEIEAIFIDRKFLSLLETYCLAYHFNRVSLDGRDYDRTDLGYLSVAACMISAMEFGPGSEREAGKVLLSRYAEDMERLEVIRRYSKLIPELSSFSSGSEAATHIPANLLVLHEIGHVIAKKYPDWIKAEMKHLRRLIRKEIKSIIAQIERDLIVRKGRFGAGSAEVLRTLTDLSALKDVRRVFEKFGEIETKFFEELFCEFFAAKNIIATNYDSVRDEREGRKLLFAGMCTLDAILKLTSGANGVWTLGAAPGPITDRKVALINAELQTRGIAQGLGLLLVITEDAVVDHRTDVAEASRFARILNSLRSKFHQTRDIIFWEAARRMGEEMKPLFRAER
jgi:hypothetical protein